MKSFPKYLLLVHHPIINKRGDIVTTSVTNLDIHDIARSARTFGFDGYIIVTPVKKQHELVRSILDHWNTDVANQYNPDRQSALSFIHLVSSIEEAQELIYQKHQEKPYKVVTGANFESFDGDSKSLCEKLDIDKRPMMLIFGTGWGLHASVIEAADYKLCPISGTATDGYNHLSVRSAVAIYCDRISRSLSSL